LVLLRGTGYPKAQVRHRPAPGVETCQQLFAIYSAFYGEPDPETFYQEMIENKRLLVQIQLERAYEIIATGGRRPQTDSGDAAAK
jgi:hypothetical protein